MNRSLALALLEYSPGWELLLEQIGAPFRVLHNIAGVSPEQVAVVIVNRHLWEEEVESLEAFVRDGGAVLDVGQLLPRLEAGKFRRAKVRSVFADPQNGLLREYAPLDLYSRVRRREGGELDGLLSIEERGKGIIASIGFDPGHLMLDCRAATKRFPSLAGRYPAERVSRISKGELEKLLRKIFIRLYAALGLPFIRKRSFPDDAASVLCFRIDSDYGSRQQIASLYDLARDTGTAMTWFLHVEAHNDWLDTFASFSGQEIALHCWRHRTFPERMENYANIADGLAALRSVGIKVEGFAAPNGIWNHGLGRAIDEHGFLYSSEFALAYDALPFRPILPRDRRVNERFYNAVQVPIHPVSVGNLLRVGMDEAQMIDYYRGVTRRKTNAGDSLIFYHHPTHERWDVMEALLLEAKHSGARSITFADYARWWKTREEASIEAGFQDDRVTISSRDRDPSVWLDVVAPDGRHGMIEGDGTTRIADLAAPPSQHVADELEAPTTIREFSWRLKRRAVHDWIIRTSR